MFRSTLRESARTRGSSRTSRVADDTATGQPPAGSGFYPWARAAHLLLTFAGRELRRARSSHARRANSRAQCIEKCGVAFAAIAGNIDQHETHTPPIRPCTHGMGFVAHDRRARV